MTTYQPPGRVQAKRSPADTLANVPDAAAVSAEETQQRLRILVLVALGSFATVGIISWLIPFIVPPETLATSSMGVLAATVVILSSGMFWLLRQPRSAQTLGWLGIGFVVLVALAMAAAEVALAPEIGTGRWGVSGIGIWIVLFPLVYPLSPRTALGAALACASAVPMVYGIGQIAGAPSEPWSRLLPWMLPLYFCAGLAVVAAFSIHRYRRALEQAKRQLREYGRYELIRLLGKGGMGEVWLARHRLLPRSAAIKFVIPPVEADDARRESMTRQFEAEAAAIARLSSVHTVTLYDFGVTDNGEWYYVMELLDGIDLEQAITLYGPLPDWRVVHILAQACRSLAEAHRQHLIHRDMKPGNLMLCRLGDELDVVKVVDFGLVGCEPHGLPNGPLSTWAGSSGYVAPEVLLGESAADGRGDLYALGCVAWWLMTGRTVFAEAKNVQDECVLHCTAPPPVAILRVGGHEENLIQLIIELLGKRADLRPADADATRQRLMSLACWNAYDEAAVTAWWAKVRPATSVEALSTAAITSLGANSSAPTNPASW